MIDGLTVVGEDRVCAHVVLGGKLEDAEPKAGSEGRNFKVLENPQLEQEDRGPGSRVRRSGVWVLAHWIRLSPKKFWGPLPRVVPILTPLPVVPQSHKSVDCPSNQSGFAEEPNVDQSALAKHPDWWETNPSLHHGGTSRS